MGGYKEIRRRVRERDNQEVYGRGFGGGVVAGDRVSDGVIHKWKNAVVRTDEGEPDKEKLAMRKRIRELEMENEILKKAALILGRPG